MRTSAERIEAGLAEVFGRREFLPEEDGWFSRFVREVLDGLSFGRASSSLTWILFTVFGLVLGYALLRALRSYQPRAAAREDAEGAGFGAPSADERVRELARRSREARERGELVLALRLSFFALVVGLSRRGDLEYRDAWTNRELVQRGRAPAPVAGELATLVADLDAKTFGSEPVELADLEHLDALHARWLGEHGGAA